MKDLFKKLRLKKCVYSNERPNKTLKRIFRQLTKKEVEAEIKDYFDD